MCMCVKGRQSDQWKATAIIPGQVVRAESLHSGGDEVMAHIGGGRCTWTY